MKIYLQTMVFNPLVTPLKDCNLFLRDIGERVESVTPLYDTASECVVYVVAYWVKEETI